MVDYVRWKDLDEVLDRHADGVVKRLRPELDSIDKRLDDGQSKFDKLEDEVQQIRIDCVKRHSRLRDQTPPQGEDVEDDVEHDKEVKAIKSKTAAIVAIVTAILTGGGIILLLILTILGKLPSP